MADLKMVLEKTNDLKWKIDSILKYSCAEEAGDSKEGGRGTSGICRQRGGAPGGAAQRPDRAGDQRPHRRTLDQYEIL